MADLIDRRTFLRAFGSAGVGLTQLSTASAQLSDNGVQTKVAGPMQRHVEQFEKQIDLVRQSLDIPGMSVAVLHQQAVVFARGFGIVDLANGTKATEHTPYPIASITKTFAAAIIMRLVEDGKLDLDAAFSTYDPAYAQWCAKLQSATSPFVQRLAKDYNCGTERISVRHHMTHTAQGSPGTHYRYNGLLFGRLSTIVDTVSEKGYVRSLKDDILAPLDMRDTALGPNDPSKADLLSHIAKPYRLDADWKLVESPDAFYGGITASYGIISTVMDLAKYDIGIDHDLVYSAWARQQIWTAATSPNGQRFPYGLGWFVRERAGHAPRLLWHYGQFDDAYSSILLKVPDAQLTLIFVACTDRASTPFSLGDGDPLRSPFVTLFLDTFGRAG